jgi:hypothetical protein
VTGRVCTVTGRVCTVTGRVSTVTGRFSTVTGFACTVAARVALCWLKVSIPPAGLGISVSVTRTTVRHCLSYPSGRWGRVPSGFELAESLSTK